MCSTSSSQARTTSLASSSSQEGMYPCTQRLSQQLPVGQQCQVQRLLLLRSLPPRRQVPPRVPAQAPQPPQGLLPW
jgi:hypothetical protein